MKSFLYLLLALPLALSSCGKDDCPHPEPEPAPPVVVVEQGLEGNWRWVKSVGGLTGNYEYTPYDTGEELIWAMGPGNTCRIIANGDTVLDAFYSTGLDTSLLYNEPRNFITVHFPDSSAGGAIAFRMIYSIDQETLILTEDHPDNFRHWYVRE